MKNKFYIILTLLFLTLGVSTHAEEVEEEKDFLVPYAELLKKHVKMSDKSGIKSTGIDYLAWQADPLHEQAMDLLKATNTSEIESKESKISFWINVYNLLTIDLIVKKGERETIHNLGGLVGDPWNEFSWEIDDAEYTIGHIQHQILRPIGEPRVHFTLTCAAVSCPDLKNEPYWPEKIYSQLEKQAVLFMNNPKKGMLINAPKQGKSKIRKRKTFKVSQLFQWFNSDFENGQLNSFVTRYADIERADFGGYIEHDWSLNALKGKEPEARFRAKITDIIDPLYE